MVCASALFGRCCRELTFIIYFIPVTLFKPTLQVVQKEVAFHRSFKEHGQHTKRIKLNLSDGTNMIPTIIASQLYDKALTLERHDIIKLDTYSVNRYDFPPNQHGSKHGRQGVFLLVTGYTVLRSSWQHGDLKYNSNVDIEPYHEQQPAPEPSLAPAPASGSSASQGDQHLGIQMKTGTPVTEPRQSHQPNEDSDLQYVPTVSCRGDCCSGVEGQVFSRCMLFSHEIPDVDDVQNECWFVEQKYLDGDSAMLAKLKRNVVYWWFATNVFGAVGKHNRIVLPTCLVAAIRNKYPNKAGVPYSDGHSHGALDFYARKCGE